MERTVKTFCPLQITSAFFFCQTEICHIIKPIAIPDKDNLKNKNKQTKIKFFERL